MLAALMDEKMVDLKVYSSVLELAEMRVYMMDELLVEMKVVKLGGLTASGMVILRVGKRVA